MGSGHVHVLVPHSKLHGSNFQIYYTFRKWNVGTPLYQICSIPCLPKRLALKIDFHKEGEMGELWQLREKT